jgi:universal stress protein E
MPTPNLRSILVASDLEPSSDAALRGAAALASAVGARIHLLHALHVPSSGYAGLGFEVDVQSLNHTARRALRAQAGRAIGEADIVESQVVRSGSAQGAILGRADEVRADLIVLGPHRDRAFHGPILGCTADRVLRSANVPVLILAEPLRVPLDRIVVPVDLSDPARGALDQALHWAARIGRYDAASNQASVRVLHVVPRIYEGYDFPFDQTVVAPQLGREIDEALERTRVGRTLDVREEIVWGNSPAEDILRYVEKETPDLLVMGTHGYGALGRALIGSITSTVARVAPCPMLLVPPALWRTDEEERRIPMEVEIEEPTAPA